MYCRVNDDKTFYSNGTSTPMPVGPTLREAARQDQHDAIDMANTFCHSSAALVGHLTSSEGLCKAVFGKGILVTTKFTVDNDFRQLVK